MDGLLDQLVKSPRLGLYVDRLRGVLDHERARREQFYATMTEGTKQEFINGEVIVHSPVKLKHDRASRLACTLLDVYVRARGLGYVGHEKLLVSLTRNDYEPDVCFWGNEKAHAFHPDQMQFPAPELIVEVLSDSTESVDRGLKFDDYAAHGVREYWIIDADAELVEQYVLQGDAYALKFKMNSGMLRSDVVAGFEVPVRAIFDDQENWQAIRRFLPAQ